MGGRKKPKKKKKNSPGFGLKQFDGMVD